MAEHNIASRSAVEHARHLANTIGPRGATTQQEARAAEYACQVFEEIGVEARTDVFTSPRSAWRALAVAAILALLAEVLFLFGQRPGAVLASALMLVALACVWLELDLRGSPLRWILAKGKSQNVWAVLPAAQEVRQRVLLIAHLDTHRTPKLFSTPLWLKLFKLFLWLGPAALVLNTLIFLASIFVDTGGWRVFTLVLALVPWWILVLTVEADCTPYTAGANDNASGVGVLLSLTARLKQEPLSNTEVWALCSGSKEVGGYGSAAFLARYGSELKLAGREGQTLAACCIVLDAVGGQGARPAYLAQETYLTAVRGDSNLVRLAGEVSARRPDLAAHCASVAGMYTETRVTARAGLPTLAFVSLRKDGTLPHWHQASDISANLDGQVMQNTENLVWEFLRALDKQKSP